MQNTCTTTANEMTKKGPNGDVLKIIPQPHGVLYQSSLYGRPMWKALLVCRNGEPSQLVYIDIAKDIHIKIKQEGTGVVQTKKSGTLPLTKMGGVFPPNLMTHEGNPTRNIQNIRGIHAFFSMKPIS